MPIEVKELIVRAIVDPDGSEEFDADETVYNERELIIADCVEQVLNIIKREKER